MLYNTLLLFTIDYRFSVFYFSSTSFPLAVLSSAFFDWSSIPLQRIPRCRCRSHYYYLPGHLLPSHPSRLLHSRIPRCRRVPDNYTYCNDTGIVTITTTVTITNYFTQAPRYLSLLSPIKCIFLVRVEPPPHRHFRSPLWTFPICDSIKTITSEV